MSVKAKTKESIKAKRTPMCSRRPFGKADSRLQYLLTKDLTVCIWGTESYYMKFRSHIFRGEFERQNKSKEPTKLLFCIN